MPEQPIMPSEVDAHVSLFDRAAAGVSRFMARPAYFFACVLLVLVWLPSRPLFASSDEWQLPVNTVTTIVTFITVALIQNAEARADAAVQHKLNAIAGALADLIDDVGDGCDASELRQAVGLEQRESA